MRVRDEHPGSYSESKLFFWVINPWSEIFWPLDPRSGIKHPGSATLFFYLIYLSFCGHSFRWTRCTCLTLRRRVGGTWIWRAGAGAWARATPRRSPTSPWSSTRKTFWRWVQIFTVLRNRSYFLRFRFRFRLLTSYGYGSDFWQVAVLVPVPAFDKLRFRFRFRLLIKVRFRFRFRLFTSYGSGSDCWQVSGYGSGSGLWQVPVPVSVPTFDNLRLRFRFRYRFRLRIWTIKSTV